VKVRCVYYVGNKEERARKYQSEVQPLQFNVLVTTYEFIMRDRAKLSKVPYPPPSPAALPFPIGHRRRCPWMCSVMNECVL